MRYLITPTLINSWLYYMNSEEPDDASILATIRKVKFEATPAMEAGNKFEADVFAWVDGYRVELMDDYWACVEEVAAEVPGGVRQLKVSKEIEVDGQAYLLYGKVDHLAGPVASDVKFTGSYEFPKFKDTAQHPIYLECLDTVPVFRYLISDGRRVYEERYLRQECPPAAQLVRDMVGHLRQWPEAWKAFDAAWRAYG